MKRILPAFLIIFCLYTQSCSDKEKKDDDIKTSEVPAVVQSAFTAKYPEAVDIKWERAKEDNKPTFKAKFKSAGRKVKAEFSEDGTFIDDKAEED